MRRFHKITFFFVATFVATLLLSGIQALEALESTMISLPQFGPGTAAILMTSIYWKDSVRINMKVDKALSIHTAITTRFNLSCIKLTAVNVIAQLQQHHISKRQKTNC